MGNVSMQQFIRIAYTSNIYILHYIMWYYYLMVIMKEDAEVLEVIKKCGDSLFHHSIISHNIKGLTYIIISDNNII